MGSSVKIAPIVQWDGQMIGDGRPGPVAKALLGLLEEDMHTADRLIAGALLATDLAGNVSHGGRSQQPDDQEHQHHNRGDHNGPEHLR